MLERAAVLCETEIIEPSDLALPDTPLPPERLLRRAEHAAATDHRQVMDTVEKERLVAALRAAGGNRSQAARALGMARTTLINKLRRHGLA
ncbi:MAG TPA: helix-turn-helix domain-containing protein [Kofleriaceae bacterium]|nr:helix-turn-helix domain-containing protein [Kofleriaceae bacterium]